MKGKDRRQKKDKEMPCQVCFQGNYEEGMLDRIICIGCERSVHRNCYLPEVRGKFKCDECKHQGKNKDAKVTCSTCGNDSEKGLMKNVGNDQFMHIYCAFASNRTRLANYKTLTFLTSDKPSLRKTNGRNRCVNCNFDKCAGLSCTIEGCPNFSHLTCVLNPTKQKESEQEYSSFLTIGLLDKHENSLLSHVLSNKDLQGEFKGLDLLLSHKKTDIRYFVCTEHNLEEFFNWCTCTESKSNANANSIQCETCKRWLHSDCDAFDKQCSGCTKNNIYKKNVRLPELIEKALEVETCSQLDKTHIKYLDHFCLKLSEDLVKIISKNSFEVQRYYLRKVLESQVADENISILETLFYLFKKELKQESDITPSDIEEILSVNFSKNNKYEVKDKSEKPEKRFKPFLETKLKELQKDGTQGIKIRLNALIKKSEEPNCGDKELAKDLFDLVSHLQASQGWKETYTQFPGIEGEKHIIEFFYQMKFTAQDIENFLSALRIILNSKAKGNILQADYELIAPIINKSPADGKTKIFTSVIKNLMKGLVLRRTYKEKLSIKADLEAKTKTCKSLKERQGIRTSIISNNILISSNSPLVQFQKDSAQISVLRRMILRKYQDPTPNKLQQAQSLINKLLGIDSRIHSLKDSQRKEFQQMKNRFAFYSKIYNFVKDDSQMDIEPSGSSESMVGEEGEKKLEHDKKIERPSSLYPIKQWVTSALMNWNVEEEDSIMLGLLQLDKLALNKVEFQEKEREMINTFAQAIVDYFNKKMEVGVMRPVGTKVAKLGRIIAYAKIEDRFTNIIGLNTKYIEWKKELDKKFPDISQTLQSAKASSDLLRIVEAKLEEAKDIELDLSSEVRKLKSIRMWAILSQKLHPQHKATIASTQQTKALMDRIFYPSNALRKKVEALEIESRSLNKRIGNFLEKPKLGDQQLYEEMKLMKGKMALRDGEELRNDLNISQLDVQMELQELIEEIKEYSNLPKDLKKLADETSNLDHLLAIRRKIFENSFRLQNLDDYHYLLMRITQLKCSEYSLGAPIAKKQYLKFINFAGQIGSDLYSETTHQLKAYKDVEKAEKDILGLKPKNQNLLPADCKKVRQDLRDDPTELQKVNKWWNASEKAKERFRSFRNFRPEYSQLTMIQNELLKIPINNRQTLNQIGKIKKELDELTNKIRSCIGDKVDQTTVLESPYLQGHFMHYYNIGVRTVLLDRFEMLYQKNKIIMETARKLTPETYGNFRAICQDSHDLSHNNEVYKAREDAFNKMTEFYLESNEPLMQIGCTLLGEGGYLLKYPNKATDILNRLFAINQKFNKWSQPSRQAVPKQLSSEEVSPEGSQPNEDSDMMEQDQESQMLDDLDEEDDFSDSESQQPENRKRPRPDANEVVQLDDD